MIDWSPPAGITLLQAHILLWRTHTLFWCISNKFSKLFLCFHKYEYLKLIVTLSKISWFCYIIGFGGVVTRSITGVSVFILSACISGINKLSVSHRWHVPKWTLLALIFTKFKVFKVDSLIYRYLDDRYNVEPTHIIFDSGFSSKFTQCVSLYTLFAGGVSKLKNSGISWILPGNLSFHLSDPSVETITVLATVRCYMRRYILRYLSCIFLLSSTRLLVELISILGCFLPFTRLSIVIIACSFHIGIWFLLPDYFLRCICYLMIINIPFSNTNVWNGHIGHIRFLDILFITIAAIVLFGHPFSLIF